MSRKTFLLVAVAAMTTLSVMIPGVDGAAALARASDVPADLPLPDALAQAPAAAERASETPEPVQFIAEPVVQPLPVEATPPTPAEAASLAELVAATDTAQPLTEQLRCLAGAVYFESRGEPLAGQLAVAQVIINRAADGRFPRSYCGVVLQKGQFSFVRGGRMPQARTGTAAWQRAVAIAQIADQGLWQSEAGEAVFFHAHYVRPGWSRTKTRLAQIDTHIFYR